MGGRSGGLPGIGKAFSVRCGIFVFPRKKEVNLIPAGDKNSPLEELYFNCIVLEQLLLSNVMSVDSKAVVIILPMRSVTICG